MSESDAPQFVQETKMSSKKKVSTTSVEALFGGSSDWRLLEDSSETSDEKVKELQGARDYLRDELSSVIGAENLVVLAGLGTSLSVGSPSMSTLWSELAKLNSYKKIVSKLDSALIKSENFEHILSDAHARYALNSSDTELKTFIDEAEKLVLEKCSFVNDETDLTVHQTFLRKVARRSTRLQRAQLFTTNYDIAFEQAARKARFNIIDGFGFGDGDFDGGSFDLDFVRRRLNEQPTLEPSVFHLLKLHGSVDWDGSNDTIRRVTGAPAQPLLVYPSAEKYQLAFRQPYLEFTSRFQIALRQPDVGLLVVGFGFNDEHIVAPIQAALRSNIGLRAVIVDPAVRSDTRNEAFSEIENLIGLGDRRLTLLEGTFEDLVRVLPDVPPLEERDAHLERISKRSGGSS